MKIRLAKDEDCSAIARLHRQTIRNINSKDYSKDQVTAWSARTNSKRFRDSANKCKRWVAVESDKIVGFCDHSIDGEFWGLYIHKDYIGKGIGSRLLKIAEDSLKKMGFKKVSLKATVTAKEFYKRQGYKVTKKNLHPVNDEKLKEYSVPVPPIYEQKQIVKKLDELSGQTKKLETSYQQKLTDLEELKKSVFKKAFNGEL